MVSKICSDHKTKRKKFCVDYTSTKGYRTNVDFLVKFDVTISTSGRLFLTSIKRRQSDVEITSVLVNSTTQIDDGS